MMITAPLMFYATKFYGRRAFFLLIVVIIFRVVRAVKPFFYQHKKAIQISKFLLIDCLYSDHTLKTTLSKKKKVGIMNLTHKKWWSTAIYNPITTRSYKFSVLIFFSPINHCLPHFLLLLF